MSKADSLAIKGISLGLAIYKQIQRNSITRYCEYLSSFKALMNEMGAGRTRWLSQLSYKTEFEGPKSTKQGIHSGFETQDSPPTIFISKR